jgi:hypothetical protein
MRVQTRPKLWIFKGDTNPQHTFLLMGNKTGDPMPYDFTACKRTLRSMIEMLRQQNS